MILRNRSNLQEGVNIKEDYPKEIIEKRKQLQLQVEEEKKKGNVAFIKYDKLIIRKTHESNREKKEKRDFKITENTITKESQCRKNLVNNNKLYQISERNHSTNSRTTESLNEIITSDAETGIKYRRLQNKFKDMLVSKPRSKESYLSKKTLELLDERRTLISNKEDKERRQKIATLSKEIKENMRKDRKEERNRVLEENIKRTGGTKKAMKQLSEHGKEWIAKLKQRESYSTNRLSIQKLATDYYRLLYSDKFDSGMATIPEVNEVKENKVDEVPEILTSEVIKAIKSQKLKKAPGPDKIPNEMLKGSLKEISPVLAKLFNKILQTRQIPEEWTECHIILLHNKENPAAIEQMMQSLANISREVGLEINASKTKLMSNSREIDVMVDGNKIEYVKEYIYLGQIISPSDEMTKEINRRIAQGWRKYWSLKEIVKSKDLGNHIKKKTFETCILPVLTYGCETWSTTLYHRERLTKCQRAMERSMLGLKIKDRVRNDDIRTRTKLTDILTRINVQKWRWAGHLLRHPINKWSKQVTLWQPRDGKRGKGRQVRRWEDDLKQTAGPFWLRVARDRNHWKKLEEAYAKRHTELRDLL
ncbi:unnamed protein product [Parnassius mnemosyne]|uniref:Reverse transcriptase domain-containing protein n=1 Tax=Parnassius mnemosyne TaxID=213953 RepID=A0AAV1LU76_9NEOP